MIVYELLMILYDESLLTMNGSGYLWIIMIVYELYESVLTIIFVWNYSSFFMNGYGFCNTHHGCVQQNNWNCIWAVVINLIPRFKLIARRGVATGIGGINHDHLPPTATLGLGMGDWLWAIKMWCEVWTVFYYINYKNL